MRVWIAPSVLDEHIHAHQAMVLYYGSGLVENPPAVEALHENAPRRFGDGALLMPKAGFCYGAIFRQFSMLLKRMI